MRLAVLFLGAAGGWQLFGAEVSTATPSSLRDVIKGEFRYDPSKRTAAEKAKEADGKGEAAVIKMDPYHVYVSKYPPASAVVKPRGSEGLDLNAERHLFSGALRHTPLEMGILKHRDIIPFGAPMPRWDILRLKW